LSETKRFDFDKKILLKVRPYPKGALYEEGMTGGWLFDRLSK
jgi:hypothetical protein